MSAFLTDERTSGQYTATLKDETDTAIAAASFATMTLTLYDAASGSIINSRNGQNVLNANNVTINDTSGLLTWALQPADSIVLDQTLAQEEHVALFEYTFGASGGKRGSHEVRLVVRNINRVTTPA